MLAWQKHFNAEDPKKPQEVHVPIPSAPPDGLLIKIHAAGVCHSDFALLDAQLRAPYMNDQYTLGHEGAGEVVEVGSDVKDGEWKVGDRVAILSVAGCQRKECGECSRDLAQICQTGEHYGIGVDGSYAEYIAIKAHAAAKLPDGVPYEQGAVATDACMTAYHAVVGTGDVKKGETVVIIGIGGLGFNGMQIAKARGARVIVKDNRQEVLDEAVKFGISKDDIVPKDQAVDEWVKEKGIFVDTVVDFAGKEETFSAAQKTGKCRVAVWWATRVLTNMTYSSIWWQACTGWIAGQAYHN